MSENEQVVSGDLYISIERVRENSKLFKQQTKKELARVILHGVLHLMGYDDQKAKDIQLIRKKEEEYLKKLALW
jgi:rRNA maturation RNase YbeY